jgi:fucose permease
MVTHSLHRRTTGGAFVLFGLLGAIQALFGPSIPAMRTAFHISIATAGLSLSAFFLGAIGGIVLAGVAGSRVALRWRLSIASLLVMLGCFGLATAHAWPIALAGVFVAGLGDGGLVVTFNTVFASGFGDRSPAMLNLLNAAFGCGAILGPLLVGVVLGSTFRTPYLFLAILVLCMLPTVVTAPGAVVTTSPNQPEHRSPSLHLLITFIALFFLYEGLEADISGWEATQLVSRGFSAAAAANATAIFWAALTAGRVVIAPLSVRFNPQRIVILALGAMTLLMVMAHLPVFTLVAYTLAGTALASVFPLGFLWLRRTFPHSARAPSLALLAALSGGVVFPPVVGKWISLSTPEVLPTALTVVAVFCLLVALRLRALAPLH